MDKQTTVTKITQKDLIDEIVDDFDGVYSRETVTDVILDLQENIINHLRSATVDKPVSIRPLMGLVLSSKVIAEQKVSFKDMQYIRSERLKAKAKMSRYFNRITLNGFDR